MIAGLQAARRQKGPLGLVRRFVDDESAQDLVEYGLMACFIGIAGYLVLMHLGIDIFNTYDAWLDPSTGVPSLWDPPEPSGGGS